MIASAFAFVGKDVAHDGQRRGHHHCRANGEEHAGGDQPLGGGRERGAQRRDGKHRQSGEKQPHGRCGRSQHAGAGQQAGHHQRVGVDDPEFCEALASSARVKRGRAVYNTVISMTIRKRALATIVRINQRFWRT